MSKTKELTAKELRDQTWEALIKSDPDAVALYEDIWAAIMNSVKAGYYTLTMAVPKRSLARANSVLVKLGDLGISGYITKGDGNIIEMNVTWGALT